MTIELSRSEARTIAVRAAMLGDERPDGFMDMVRRLAALRIEETAAVAPAADHVSWSRLGDGYVPGLLDRGIAEGRLFEYQWAVRPMDDLPMFLPTMRAPSPYPAVREWLEVNAPFRRRVIAKLADLGPLTSADIADESIVPWPSSGWTNNRNVPKMLDLMHQHGELAVVGHDGRYRVFDRVEEVFPEVDALEADIAMRTRNERRLAAFGVVRAKAAGSAEEQADMAQVGEEATIEGVRGVWRVDRAVLESDVPTNRTVILSPFDRLVFERDRVTDIFEFEYALEMYKPVAKRRWGYFALPVLHHDRLIGKVDATSEHAEGVLRVDAVHEDGKWTKAMRDAVAGALHELADRLGLEVLRV
ncbi:MAG: crosslink repair DNA glycosylase YcaQ family protein [Pseudolysinimonas sp.]